MKRPGRNETLDHATLGLEIKGQWAGVFEMAPEAQRLLCEEIGRAIPGIMRCLKNYESHNTEYTAIVYPVRLQGGG